MIWLDIIWNLIKKLLLLLGYFLFVFLPPVLIYILLGFLFGDGFEETIESLSVSAVLILICLVFYLKSGLSIYEDNVPGKKGFRILWLLISVINVIFCLVVIWSKMESLILFFDIVAYGGLSKLISHIIEKNSEENRTYEPPPSEPKTIDVESQNEQTEIPLEKPPVTKPTYAPPKSPQKATSKRQDWWKHKETWEDYPTPNYEAVHTYCTVVFEDNDQTFYYRTRNPYLEVGDKVCVPVGYESEEKIGTIIEMKDYKGKETPYPLEKTKHIIDKV